MRSHMSAKDRQRSVSSPKRCVADGLAAEILNLDLLSPVLQTAIVDNEYGEAGLWEAGAAALVLSCLLRVSLSESNKGDSYHIVGITHKCTNSVPDVCTG